MRILVVLALVVLGVSADSFSDFLTHIQEKYTFMHLSETDKLLFSELVVSAEENDVNAFIDRAGFSNVLKLFSHLSHDDAKTLETYLLSHMSNHSTSSKHSHDKRQWWNHHTSSGKNYDLSLHSINEWFVSNILHDLPSNERKFMTALVDAATKNQLTKFVTDHGYESVISILSHLDDHRAEMTEAYIIQHLEREATQTSSS